MSVKDLVAACASGNPVLVGCLLEDESVRRDIDATARHSGKIVTALCKACQSRKIAAPQVIDMLLDAGADIEAPSGAGYRPLHVAVYCKSTTVTRVLLDKGANVNACTNDGSRPLHMAVYMNSKAMVDLLLDAGADVNAAMDDGRTPLCEAAQKANEQMCLHLIERGATFDHMSLEAASRCGLDLVLRQMLESDLVLPDDISGQEYTDLRRVMRDVGAARMHAA